MAEEAKVAGYDCLIKVNTGTDEAPVFTVLGGQEDATLDLPGDVIDTSSKDGEGYKSNLPGLLGWSVSLDNFYCPTNAAYNALVAARKARKQIMVQLAMSGDDAETFTGKATISSMSLKTGMKEGAKNTMKLEGSGPLLDDSNKITAPTITTPTQADTDVVVTAAITTSAFTVSAGSDTHASSQVQVSLVADTAFTTRVIDNFSSVNKVSFPIAAGVLAAGTEYRVRARHCGTKYGWSAWSTVHTFTTAA
jgi:hypothetical protein